MGYAWGFGENLQLATGNDEDCLVPTPIVAKSLTGATIKQVTSGSGECVWKHYCLYFLSFVGECWRSAYLDYCTNAR